MLYEKRQAKSARALAESGNEVVIRTKLKILIQFSVFHFFVLFAHRRFTRELLLRRHELGASSLLRLHFAHFSTRMFRSARGERENFEP